MEANKGVEVDDSAKEKAKEMAKAYEDRPTVVLPGSHNTVSGTAVGDWLDEDGNPKYGKDEQPAAEESAEKN
jgi:hypothetical protein